LFSLLERQESKLRSLARTGHQRINERIQAGKTASLLRAIEYDWFLLIDPINHIQPVGEQANCFIRFEHGYCLAYNMLNVHIL